MLAQVISVQVVTTSTLCTSQLRHEEATEGHTHLLESHILRVFAEALTADVEAVLPDDTPLVAANTAAQHQVALNTASGSKQL